MAVGVAAAAVPRSIAIPATLSSVVLGVTPALLHLLHASGDLAIDALAVLLIQLVGLTVLEIVHAILYTVWMISFSSARERSQRWRRARSSNMR